MRRFPSVVVISWSIAFVWACSSSSATPAAGGDVDAGAEQDAALAADTGTGTGSEAGPLDSAVAADTNAPPAADAGSDAPPGSATITGGPPGKPPLDATSFNKDGKLTVKITDYAGACALEAANNAHKAGSTYLEIYLGTYPGATGTFTIGTAVDVEGWTRDATCSGTGTPASAGTVTIATISSSEVTGSLAVTLGGTSLSGTFRAPVCNGGAVVGTGGACVP